jgi:UDP-N-acetylglucosamine--dolichyl-phosphate N-acetylglucosaminephosphotransferase
MHARNFLGKDMNKYKKPPVAEFGGFLIFIGFTFSSIIAIFISTYIKTINLDLTLLLAGIATITAISFIGIIDDLVGWKKGIRQWQHALFPIFAALPLMAVKVNNPPLFIPLFGLLPAEYQLPLYGVISFGTLYSLFIIPIGITGASNATNMLAGLNGLEAGLGIIIYLTLLPLTLLHGRIEAAVICIAMLAALIGFIRFNWFPAKVFGGDGLTLTVGAGIAVVSILGNMEKIGVLLMALFFIELFLKAKENFQTESFGIPDKNNLLHRPKGKILSLTHLLMNGKRTEKDVVIGLLAIQALVSIVIFSISYFELFKFLTF